MTMLFLAAAMLSMFWVANYTRKITRRCRRERQIPQNWQYGRKKAAGLKSPAAFCVWQRER